MSEKRKSAPKTEPKTEPKTGANTAPKTGANTGAKTAAGKKSETAAENLAHDPVADLLDSVEIVEESSLPATPSPFAAITAGITEAFADAKNAVAKENPPPPPCPPAMHSPEWTTYALSLLSEEETVDGKPRVAALRRLVPLLLGDVVRNVSEHVLIPSKAEDRAATVRTILEIRFRSDVEEWENACGRERGDPPPPPRIFTGLADVFAGNVSKSFLVFPSAVAETRSEGRALRKALMLQTVTAEECSGGETTGENATPERITQTQITFIDVMCRKLDVDADAYLKSWKFGSVDAIPYDKAVRIFAHLSGLQSKRESIPAEVKGYEEGWLERHRSRNNRKETNESERLGNEEE